MKKNDLMTETTTLGWRVHTSNLLNEIMINRACGALKIPVTIFSHLLAAVGERAAQLNDSELNKLMTRLTIYDFADPQSKNYDLEKVQEILS